MVVPLLSGDRGRMGCDPQPLDLPFPSGLRPVLRERVPASGSLSNRPC